ncbi:MULTISPECIES: RHS repeat-associated core domain-containing protein [unclassified Streptosporangium]|uniref:RHS repeat-associated core domain-containing protein n=1 Tax=unclassified Streptosporangium TaxID=2632669 RepID=UPI002E2CD7F0|nr:MULTISPECIES: LamG-like jellyroll fold domain-containing protein [unclassified Streptosporangium]
MRRSLSWSFSARVKTWASVVVITAVTPGLLLFQAVPVSAAMQSATLFHGTPDTPDQLTGSAAGFPSLVDSKATTEVSAMVVHGQWRSDIEPPEGAVPVEERFVDQQVTSTQAGALSKISATPAQSQASLLAGEPSLLNTFPRSGMLMDSLTPTLRAQGRSTVGGSVRYAFKICDKDTMTGTGCTSSGTLAAGVNTWKVPASKLAWSKQYWWTVTVTDTSNSMSTLSPVHTFVTGVRQPVVTSLLATPGVSGQEFHQQSGNYTTTATDLSVPTAGPPLSVTRSYNSMDSRTGGVFGAGWSTRWDMKLVKEVRGAAVAALVTYPDGRQVRFMGSGAGVFQPPPGMHATLTEDSGGTWRLMDKSATTYAFDAQGRLTEVTDSRGRGQELTYGAGGKLSTVTATGGRSLTFTWTGAHVTSVSSDPVDGAPLTWTYHYDGDRLTGVCAPVAAPNCTHYSYGTGSQYRSGVLDADPYAYWRLGEASGTVAADQGAGQSDATYQAVGYAKPGALAGSTDTAVEFTTGSALKLPANMVPHLGDQISVEAWFKTSQSGVLMAAGTQDTSGIPWGPMLYVGTDGKLRGSLAAVAAPITSVGVVNDNTWHHVVLTVSGQNQTLFLDGAPVGTLSAAVTAWRDIATVGNGVADPATSPAVPSPRAAFPFKGFIDEVAIYDKPLTEAEVSAHHGARAEAAHKLTGVTLPSGRVWASNTYDAATDRLTTHVDHNGGTWKIGAQTYDPQNGAARVTVTDPRNKELKYLYDAWRGYRIIGETDQLGHTSWHEYNQSGSLAKLIDRNDIVNDVYFDERGNLIARKYCRAAGECAIETWKYHLNTSDAFDPRNDQVTVYRDGRSASDTDTTYATTTEYTSHGEVTKVTSPATSDFPAGRSVISTYTDGTEPAIGGGTTPAGLLESAKDAKGNETTYRYTASGQVAEQTSPAGLKTTSVYDAVGRMTSRTKISQAHPSGISTTFTYDGRGRLLTQTEPGVKNEVTNVTHTAKTTLTYDVDGSPLTITVSDLTGGDPARTTIYTYDAFGRAKTVTDPEGGVTASTWNGTGAQTSQTDPAGTVVTFAYTDRGEPASHTLKNWTGSPVSPQAAQDVVLESFSYDFGGRLAGQIDAMGRKKAYTYWMDNRAAKTIGDDVLLNSLTTPDDVVLQENEYDPAGNLVRQVSGGGKATVESVYDAGNRLTSTTFDPAALGRKTAFEYDAANNVTKKISTATGTTRTESTSYLHNALNQVTRQTVENGADDLVTTSVYDDRGLLSATTDPRGNASGATPADFTATLRYDLAGQLVETKAAQVTIEKNGTATTGHPTLRYGYNSAGLQTQAVDAEGRTTTSVFDKAGRLTSMTGAPYTPPGGSAITPAVSFGYDVAGRQITVTDPRNNVTSTVYDALGRPVKVTEPGPSGPGGVRVAEYDLLGEQLAVIDPTGARTEATYDGLGRTITQTQIERTPVAAAHITALTYDSAGNLIKRVAPGPGNKTTTYTVNAAGEVTHTIAPATPATTNPATRTTTFGYDLMGRQTKVTDALGNATEAIYDLAGRKTAAKDLTGTDTSTVVRTVGFGYDPAGNPTNTTSSEGYTTQRTFDALGRMTSLVEPVSASSSITSTFGYDASGARTRTTDGRGNATWTSYNSLGLVESVLEPATTAHPNAADRTWTSLYDTAGNATATLQPGGVRTDRTFDHLNRMTAETGSGTSVATPARAVTYDEAGRVTAIGDYTLEYNDRSLLTKVSKATNQIAAYTYDATGNLTQRVDPAGTANYTWDAVDRLNTASDPVTGRTWTYGYDNANRLTSKTSATPVGTQTYGYDAVNRLTSQTVKNSSGTELSKIVYGWDKDDNLTTKTTTGTAGAGVNTYGYDHSGRITSWTAPGGVATAYEWDASGNRTKAGSQTFAYDQRNRLTSGAGTDYTYTPRGTTATETKASVTRNLAFDAFDRLVSDGDATYGYDALDRMTSRTEGSDQQRFVYSGLSNNLVTTTDSVGAVQAKYGRDPFGGLLSLQEGASPALATMNDLRGDVVATFSATTLVDSVAYDPFGIVTHRSGTQRSLGYQGEYTDPDTGKVNMHARWYQPGTGAFTSRDTATLNPNPSVQANRYTYANANPLTNTDPSGHNSIQINTVGSSNGASGGSSWQSFDMNAYLSNYFDRQSSSSWDWTPPEVIPGQPYNAWGGYVSDLVYTGPDDETDNFWWSRNYGAYAQLPQLGDDEIKRLGYKYMHNGREVDQVNYWDAEEDVQQEYLVRWSPTADESQLNDYWVRVGGLESLKQKNVTVTAGGVAYYQSSVGKIKFKDYDQFKHVLRHYDAIKRAAKNHGIDKNILAAVIMWESNNWEVKFGGIGAIAAIADDAKNPKTKGWGASVGVPQLELYKARMMLEKYYGKKWANATVRSVMLEMLKPSRAIHLAAAWMKHLKENVWYMKDGAKHYLDDKEAAIAYCGCAGVWVDNPASGNTELNTRRFVAWAESNFQDNTLIVKRPEDGINRRNELMGLWAKDGAADQYWHCNSIGWDRCY